MGGRTLLNQVTLDRYRSYKSGLSFYLWISYSFNCLSLTCYTYVVYVTGHMALLMHLTTYIFSLGYITMVLDNTAEVFKKVPMLLR